MTFEDADANKAALVDRVAYLAGEMQGLAEDVHAYQKLFEDVEVRHILAKIAPRLFLRFRANTKDAVFLAMARITDPKAFNLAGGEGEGRKNISIMRIQEDIKELELGTPRDRKRINKAVERMCLAAKPIRNVRSRQIAHLDDLDTRDGALFAPDGGFKIHAFLDQCQIFMDAVVACLGWEKKDGYIVQPKEQDMHADAFLMCLKYLDENWADLEQDVQNSNSDRWLDRVSFRAPA